MLNLDQFRAMGIASEADVETINSYEDSIPYYEENAYTYIPIPSADKYYHVEEGELRNLHEDQHFHPDLTMMDAFERLQDHPFLLHDHLMNFESAPADADRDFIPDGQKRFETEEESYTVTEMYENQDDLVPRLKDAGVHPDVIQALIDMVEERYKIVTLADANKRRARELFYQVVSEFEIQLAYQVKSAYPNSLIEEVGDDEIERWYRAKIDKLEIHIAEHMHLSTLLTVAGKSEEIRERFGFPSRTKFDDNLGGLNDLRHKVMHPTRALVHDPDDLEHEVDRVDRVRSALEALDEEEIQPDYPNQSDT